MKHPLRAFRRVNSPRTLILSSSERCYCTIVTFVALHSTVSINPCLPCSGKPRTSIAGVASSLLGRGEGLSPFTSFAARVHCWLMINLVSIRTPRCFSPKLLSRWVAPGMPTPCTGKFCFINVLFESENLISTPTPPPNPQICGDCFVVIFFFLKTDIEVQLNFFCRQFSLDRREKLDVIFGAQKLVHVLVNPADNSLLSAIQTAVGENIKKKKNTFKFYLLKLLGNLSEEKKKTYQTLFSSSTSSIHMRCQSSRRRVTGRREVLEYWSRT